MQASPLTSRIRRWVTVQDWQWWQLPPVLRRYVAAVTVAAICVMGIACARTDWRPRDLASFALLMCCGAISISSTPRIAYASPGGLTRDFTAVWVLPIAILLPPVYAAVVSIPFVMIMQLFVHRGVVYRRVFTAASISLSYAAASWAFRSLPASLAGEAVGTGLHAFTWAVAVAGCYMLASRVQHFLIVGAVKLSDPTVRIWQMEWNREALQGLFVEIDLGVLITLAVAISPALVVIAVPTVFLVRRFLVHPILVAQSRVDAKTGLLNVSTWEREAEIELSRSVRTRQPLALAMLDIDHFKRVNDTHGHLVGDRMLRAVAEAIKGQSRDYDKAGRFGGEEFVLLLAQADEDDACRIAERLRAHIGDLVVPIDDRPEAPVVQVTISIGVSAMERGTNRELADLLTAADSALYRAKQAGRNRVCMSAPVQAGQLAAEIASRIGLVQEDPAGAALCPEKSL
ncbi:MAG: putative diguanylate cyclase [Actinomycetia bacterium]|nr:putative diguanylate cyclase [Actinomycetes bacterium]